jgi:hypothetical protein
MKCSCEADRSLSSVSRHLAANRAGVMVVVDNGFRPHPLPLSRSFDSAQDRFWERGEDKSTDRASLFDCCGHCTGEGYVVEEGGDFSASLGMTWGGHPVPYVAVALDECGPAGPAVAGQLRLPVFEKRSRRSSTATGFRCATLGAGDYEHCRLDPVINLPTSPSTLLRAGSVGSFHRTRADRGVGPYGIN